MNLVDWYEIELALLVRSVLQYRNAQTFCSKGAILKYSLGSTSNILKKKTSYTSSKQLWKIVLFKEETTGKCSTARTSLGYISELFDRYLLK